MTVSTDIAAASFFGNDTVGPYTCGFKIYDQTHIEVYVDGVLKTLTTDYTVAGVGGESFTITFTAAVSTSSAVSVVRVVPLLQLTDYIDNDEFPAETHERALDLLVMMIQQIETGNTGKAIRFPPTDPATLLGVLPAAATRASKLLGFDSTGEVAAVTGTALGAFTTGDPHTWTALQTFLSSQPIEISWVDAGSAIGPVVKLFRDSASPATNDFLAGLEFEGRDQTSARVLWAKINAAIKEVTQDRGQIDFLIRIGTGGETSVCRMHTRGTVPQVEALWFDDGATEGPYLGTRKRSATPAAGDLLGAVVWDAHDSALVTQHYFKIRATCNDPTAGSVSGEADFTVKVAGADTHMLGFRPFGLELYPTAGATRLLTSSGTPEGALSGPVGSICVRRDGAGGAAVYQKMSGTGATGWEPISATFESSPQTVTADSTVTVAHGLGVRPRKVWGVWRCATTEHGYAVGDEVPIQNDIGGDAGSTMAADATNVTLTMSVAPIRLISKTTFNSTAGTPANWQAILRFEV